MSFKLSNTTFSPLFGFPQEQTVDTSPPSVDDLTLESLQTYLTDVQANSNKDFAVTPYDQTTKYTSTYVGAVYAPTKDHIYFIPDTQARQRLWHYLNCKTGEVVSYLHQQDTLTPTGKFVATGGITDNFELTLTDTTGFSASDLVSIDDVVYSIDSVPSGTVIRLEGYTGTLPPVQLQPNPSIIYDSAGSLDGVEVFSYSSDLVQNAYSGGVYCPTNNHIYLVPLAQGPEAVWHYLDMNKSGDDIVVPYTNTVSADVSSFAYIGGSYDPDNQRIYFTPRSQVSESKLHYIDCSTSTPIIGEYTKPSSMIASFPYSGAVYAPSQKRIYFMPDTGTEALATWFYIDTSVTTPTIVGYAHGFGTTITARWEGGVFSPQNDRIYFVPTKDSTEWYYIDCSTPSENVPLVIAYTNNATILSSSSAYLGGVYNPTLNRIYFVPGEEAKYPEWHYIDCDTETVVPYEHHQVINTTLQYPGFTFDLLAYQGGVYSPSDNSIYFAPYSIALQTDVKGWHKLVDFNTPTSKSIASYASFNKY